MRAEWNDQVSVLHSRLDEVIVSRLDKPVVLSQDINDGSATLSYVSLNYCINKLGESSTKCVITYFFSQV